MGFSERELVNINSAALQANTLDSNSSAVWYEKSLPFQFVSNSNNVWTQFSSIPIANTLTQARNNAAANPTIIQDLSQATSAVRLGAVPGTNKFTWACYGISGGEPTPGQPITNNWLLPQQIQNATGNPSSGYTISLYDGDPNAGGTVINAGAGQTGSGSEKSVGWVFNYASGVLLLADDFYTSTGIASGSFDPYIVGFRYIGQTAGAGGGAGSTASQVVRDITLDEAVVLGDSIRLVRSSDAPTFTNPGRAVRALATTGKTAQVIGVAAASGSEGDTISVVLNGVVDITFAVAPTADQIGADIFLSSTNQGKVLVTPPSGSGISIVKVGKVLFGDGAATTQPCKVDVQLIAQLA